MNKMWILFVLSILTFSLSTSVATSSDSSPSQGSTSFAFNSGGKGEVMVSCNGKTYKGEGIAACTSVAAYHLSFLGTTFNNGYLILLAVQAFYMMHL